MPYNFQTEGIAYYVNSSSPLQKVKPVDYNYLIEKLKDYVAAYASKNGSKKMSECVSSSNYGILKITVDSLGIDYLTLNWVLPDNTKVLINQFAYNYVYYNNAGDYSYGRNMEIRPLKFFGDGTKVGAYYVPSFTYEFSLGEVKVGYDYGSSENNNDGDKSNWYTMYLLDKKVHESNVGKFIEIKHPTTAQKWIIPIVGGFMVAAGGKLNGVAQASEPLREFTNKVNPGTFATMRGASPIMSELSSMWSSLEQLRRAGDQVVIDLAKKEQMIQKTYQDIGTLTAEGSFVYTWVGSAFHDALGFVSQYGRKILRLSTFMALCSSAGGTIEMDGTQYTYNVKDGKGSETNANDYINQANEDLTNQKNEEANNGTVTPEDKDTDSQIDKETNESIKNAMNSVKKVFDNWYAKLVAGLTLGTFGIDQASKLGIDTSGLAGTNIGVDPSLLQTLLNGQKLGLNLDGLQSIIDGQGIKVDPSGLTGQSLGIDTSSLVGQKIGLDTSGANINTNVSGNVNVNLNTPESINLNAPESIQLDTTGASMQIDPLSLTDIKNLSDNYKTYAEKTEVREQARALREDTQEVRRKAIEDQQKKIVDNDVNNMTKKNTKLDYDLGISKVESELRNEDFEENVNYKQAKKIDWKNKNSQETFTTKEGLTLKKGLNSNPQLNQQKTYNDTQLSEGKIRGKDKFVKEFLPTLKTIIPETPEGTIKRFADVNPSMREDFDNLVKNIFVSTSSEVV